MSIAPDEEAGLRAFEVLVGTDEGSSPALPRWVDVAGSQIGVLRVDAQWREEERLGFRVTLTDASSWLLYYVPELDLWSGIADVGAVGGP